MTIYTDQPSPRRANTLTPPRRDNTSTIALIAAAVVALVLFMGFFLSGNNSIRGDNSDQANSVNSPSTQSLDRAKVGEDPANEPANRDAPKE